MSVYSYFDPIRRESLHLFYEDQMIALDTDRERDAHLFNGHEVLLPLDAVDDLINHLTVMRADIISRYGAPYKALTAKEPTS